MMELIKSSRNCPFLSYIAQATFRCRLQHGVHLLLSLEKAVMRGCCGRGCRVRVVTVRLVRLVVRLVVSSVRGVLVVSVGGRRGGEGGQGGGGGRRQGRGVRHLKYKSDY